MCTSTFNNGMFFILQGLQRVGEHEHVRCTYNVHVYVTHCTANRNGRPAKLCPKEMTSVKSTNKFQHLNEEEEARHAKSGVPGVPWDQDMHGLWNFARYTYLCKISLVASYAATHNIRWHADMCTGRSVDHYC